MNRNVSRQMLRYSSRSTTPTNVRQQQNCRHTTPPTEAAARQPRQLLHIMAGLIFTDFKEFGALRKSGNQFLCHIVDKNLEARPKKLKKTKGRMKKMVHTWRPPKKRPCMRRMQALAASSVRKRTWTTPSGFCPNTRICTSHRMLSPHKPSQPPSTDTSSHVCITARHITIPAWKQRCWKAKYHNSCWSISMGPTNFRMSRGTQPQYHGHGSWHEVHVLAIFQVIALPPAHFFFYCSDSLLSRAEPLGKNIKQK